jgi:hypothetical protein
MALSDFNVVMHNARGLVGDLLVFRKRAGKTFLSKRPKKFEGLVTQERLDQRQKFRDAVLFAKRAMTNLFVKKQYAGQAKEGTSAFNVALADFYAEPRFSPTQPLLNYTGRAGDSIMVAANDPFKIVAVRVMIVAANGSVVEGGAMVQDTSNPFDWLYTLTADNVPAGETVTFTGIDRAGKTVDLVVTT